MSPDHALALFTDLVQTALLLVGPVLGASLISGILMGVIQTATQINEASLSYVVKVAAVLLTLLTVGPRMIEKATQYTKNSFESIATVVE